MLLWSPRLKAASQEPVATAFGVIPVTVWRWARALERDGVAGLVPEGEGPRRASKLTAAAVARIAGRDRQGMSKARIAAACGVSESSVRNALRPARPAGQDACFPPPRTTPHATSRPR